MLAWKSGKTSGVCPVTLLICDRGLCVVATQAEKKVTTLHTLLCIWGHPKVCICLGVIALPSNGVKSSLSKLVRYCCVHLICLPPSLGL